MKRDGTLRVTKERNAPKRRSNAAYATKIKKKIIPSGGPLNPALEHTK